MIKKTMGRSYAAKEDDVLKVKSTLMNQGFYKVPSYGITPYADSDLFSAIRQFQKSSELDVTGVIRPQDETDRALDRVAEEYPGARTPIIRCTVCGGPHGGSKGDLCPECDVKK